MEYEKEKSYKGQAIAGLTLGIIGTALALTNGNGNGILGGVFGNSDYNNGHKDRCERTVSTLESEIARLESARYTDYVGMDLYKNIVSVAKEEDAKIASVQNQLFTYVLDLDRRVALNAQEAELNRKYDQLARDAGFKLLEQKVDCCCEKAAMTAAWNSEKAAMSDAGIISYINSTFIPGTLKLPITSICPEPATATA